MRCGTTSCRLENITSRQKGSWSWNGQRVAQLLAEEQGINVLEATSSQEGGLPRMCRRPHIEGWRPNREAVDVGNEQLGPERSL
eukprot:5251003-Amphidinium_carterae.1